MDQIRLVRARPWRGALIVVCLAGLALSVGCTSFIGISHRGREVLLTGNTTYPFWTENWVRRCIRTRTALQCEDLEMEVVDRLPDPEGGAGGSDARERQLERANPELTRDRQERAAKKAKAAEAALENVGPPELDRADREAIAGAFKTLRICRETYAAERAEVSVEIGVAADGSVRTVKVKEGDEAGMFETCLTRVIKTITFEAPGDSGEQISARLRF